MSIALGVNMRILLGIVALVSLVYGCAAQAQGRTIYLSVPGGLEALAQDNPRHYEQARAIIASAEQQPQSGFFLMTYPPKQNVLFTIDEVEYRAIVTLTNWRAERQRTARPR